MFEEEFNKPVRYQIFVSEQKQEYLGMDMIDSQYRIS